MRVLVAIVVCACGKSGGDKPSPSPSPSAPPAASAPAKKGATGSVTLSGALTGTFSPKPDLAMNCGWVDNLKTGALDVSMSDGKDTFISLRGALNQDGKYEIVLGSGKLHLPHAASLTGSSGVALTGTNEGIKTTVSATYSHAVVTGDDQSVTIDGQLSARCDD